MSAWMLVQTVIDVILLCGLVLQARKMIRAPKDDPRLSRGLQLLQSKIAVLEDLSDRTEIQVKQLSAMLDQKTRDVQDRIYEAEHHVQLIKRSMEQSLEVAEIFQDKIPHQEIIERQNTKKYIHAAQLAHEGKSVEEIAALIDLPREELVLIAKINREHLVFEEDQIPVWAQTKQTPKTNIPSGTLPKTSYSSAAFPIQNFSPGEQLPSMTLEMLGDEFRKARAPIERPSGPHKDETSSLVNRFATTKIFQKAAQMLEPVGPESGSPNGTEPTLPGGMESMDRKSAGSSGSTGPSALPASFTQDSSHHHPFEFKKINLSDTLG